MMDRDKTSCKFSVKYENPGLWHMWKRGIFLSVCHLTFRHEVCLRSGICRLLPPVQNKRRPHSGCALCPSLTVMAQVNLWLTGEGGIALERVDPGSFQHEAGAWTWATRGDIKASQVVIWVFVSVTIISSYCVVKRLCKNINLKM